MYDIKQRDIFSKTWMLFHQASDAAHRAASKKLRSASVSLEQALALFVLSRSSSPPTRTEISRVLMRKPQTITSLLHGMQKAGLIARIKDDRNKKLVRVVMTQKGKETWKQIVKSHLATELISSLTSEEFNQLNIILEKLLHAALAELDGGRYPEAI